MVTKKRGLGRGLDALLGSAAEPAGAASATSATNGADADAPRVRAVNEGLWELPVEHLRRGRYQPRTDMGQEALEELAASIRAQGVVQPIVVRPLPEPDSYEIIAGERRWRAAQIAGLERVPVVVRDVPDQAAIAIALIENVQRENLNPVEEAQALRRLLEEFGLTHQQVADAVGRSRATVSNLLRLLELQPEVRALLEQRAIEMGHARALLALPVEAQGRAGREVAAKNLSVRETERLVRRLLAPPPAPAAQGSAAADPDVRRLQDSLAERLGAAVRIQHGQGGKGKLVIPYNSLDELDGILGHIK